MKKIILATILLGSQIYMAYNLIKLRKEEKSFRETCEYVTRLGALIDEACCVANHHDENQDIVQRES